MVLPEAIREGSVLGPWWFMYMAIVVLCLHIILPLFMSIYFSVLPSFSNDYCLLSIPFFLCLNIMLVIILHKVSSPHTTSTFTFSLFISICLQNITNAFILEN